MRRFAYACIFSVFITILIPLFIVAVMGSLIDNSKKDDELIKVYFTSEDKVIEINTSKYLIGVVAAEMPAEFDKEALKAQAVAARTYMIYHIDKSTHKDGAAVCTDYRHCQAWCNIDDKMEGWGDDAKKYRKKIEKAVLDTAGEVVKFDGKPINALFFSTSSGNTENAADVWGKDVEYLISVPSLGEKDAPNFKSECSMSVDEAKEKILSSVEGVDFSKGLFTNIERSQAGGIKSLETGGIEISGITLRSIFDLKSTNADITVENNVVTFKVTGYGHGVGMSQHGAEAMAKDNKNYKEILLHYYTGCKVEGV